MSSFDPVPNLRTTSDIPAPFVESASQWARSHGLVVANGTPNANSIRASISLHPCSTPKSQPQQVEALQPLLNELFQRAALDMKHIMNRPTVALLNATFLQKLWCEWTQTPCPDNPFSHVNPQEKTLGVFCSDYSANNQRVVRYNTIFADTVSELDPNNQTMKNLVAGLAAAHRKYNVDESKILFVVRPSEQDHFVNLENVLQKQVIRKTFDELAKLDRPPLPGQPLIVDGSTISVVYYLTGNLAEDYSEGNGFRTRFNLERTLAIKCPTIPLQLAASPIVQAKYPNMKDEELLKYIPNATAGDLLMLRESWKPVEESADIRNGRALTMAGSDDINDTMAVNELRIFGWSLFDGSSYVAGGSNPITAESPRLNAQRERPCPAFGSLHRQGN